MKYYHLIGSSLGLFVIEFMAKYFFELPLVLRWIFVLLQGSLLWIYSLNLLIFWLFSKRQTHPNRKYSSQLVRLPRKSVLR